MASALQPTHNLSLLPEEEFFDREVDIQRLFHAGLDTARTLTPSLFLSGPRKSGKSEILKRVYRRLFIEQESVVPFYHVFPKSVPSAEAFCREYFLRNILQFLAFLRRDSELDRAEEFDIDYAFQLAYESRQPWLVELVDRFQSGLRRKDLQTLSRLAIRFPLTAALSTGLTAFVVVDDFPHIASLQSREELALLSGDFLSALSSRRAPHLLSGVSAQVLQNLFETVEIPGNVVVYPLRGLDTQGAMRLLENLCERFEVALDRKLSAVIVNQLDHHPFYIRAVVEGARREELQLQTPREFAEVYTAELTRGNLHLYFGSLLQSANLNLVEKMKALEMLHTCVRGTLDFSALHFLGGEGAGTGPDPGKLLENLAKATLIDHGMGTVSPITGNVLRDWIEWNFNHSLRGVPMPQLRYQITASLLKRLQGTIQSALQGSRTEQMERLLSQMNCQSIPVALLDFSQIGILQQLEGPQKLNDSLAQAEQLTLPEILSISREVIKPTLKTKVSSTLLVGRGFEEAQYADERETAWLVSYCPDEGSVGLNEIQDFYEQCQRVAKENDLRRIRMWLLAEERFNQAALSFAREHSVMTSNWRQFDWLLKRLLPDRQTPLEPSASEAATFEVVIPATADSELVPVRALEQIAENLDFDDKVKGQVRMALMEASINAKEYAATPGGKIHFRFCAGSDYIIIQVRVETPAPRGARQAKPAAEAWNLKLLRSLMDETRISQGPAGLELSMTKYLRKDTSQLG